MSGMFDCWWRLFRGPQIVSTPELEPYQLESILLSMMGDGLFGSWLMARLASDPILGVLGWKKSLERVERGQYFRWVRDYFSWSSSCRTSLPLVRHFARPPSHHRSLASSSESLKSCDIVKIVRIWILSLPSNWCCEEWRCQLKYQPIEVLPGANKEGSSPVLPAVAAAISPRHTWVSASAYFWPCALSPTSMGCVLPSVRVDYHELQSVSGS